jgi:SAM-dependent methyltransferase
VTAAEERLGNDPTSELWGEHRGRYRFAGQWLRSSSSRPRVLDMACGSGFGLQILAEAGASVVGADLDALALREAQRVAPHAALVRCDAARLPFAADAFDLITSFETLEHVPDPRGLIQELRRVLRPGARLVLSTPNRDFGPTWLHTGNPFHLQEFTAAELRALLGQAFDNVSLYGQRPSPAYRYVPYLLVERRVEPSAVAWKLTNRLPFRLKNSLALAMTGRPFYPGERDYCFTPEAWQGAHALVAAAW